MLCLKCLAPISSIGENYGLHDGCFAQWFNVSPDAKFQNLMRRDSTSDRSILHGNPQNNSFFHGKFKKYSASLEGSSYILKMREIEAPELPEVEYLCNQIANSLEIPVADYFIIRLGGELVFVTKNFIIPTTFTDLQHIYHFRDDTDHSCEGLLRTVKEQTKRPYDVNVLINTILFDSLIGNHDRHGRNLAFIIKPNQATLSPIYDNVSYLSLEKGEMLKADFNPTGKISTSLTFEPSMLDYVLELKRLGYKDEIERFYLKINSKKIDDLIDNSFCSVLMKQAIKNIICKRFEEIKHEI